MGYLQTGTAAATKYEQLVERDVKLAGSYGDLTAAALTARAPSQSTADWVGAGINLLKTVEAFVSLVKNVPGAVGVGINVADLSVNITKAYSDIDTLGFISPANYAALLSSVSGIASGGAFATAIAGGLVLGVSAPVWIAIGSVTAGVGLAASYYSSARGFADKQIEQSIVSASDNLLKGVVGFDGFNWVDSSREQLDKIQTDSPFIYPLVQFIHFLSPATTVAEALRVVDSAASGASLQDAVGTLNALRKSLLGLPASPASNPEQYLAALTETFDAAKQRIRGQVCHLACVSGLTCRPARGERGLPSRMSKPANTGSRPSRA